eukprot:5365336-Alexandrium_andersonii.AAC.1
MIPEVNSWTRGLYAPHPPASRCSIGIRPATGLQGTPEVVSAAASRLARPRTGGLDATAAGFG